MASMSSGMRSFLKSTSHGLRTMATVPRVKPRSIVPARGRLSGRKPSTANANATRTSTTPRGHIPVRFSLQPIPSTFDKSTQHTSFKDMGLHGDVRDGIERYLSERPPTPIQSLGIPKVLEALNKGQDVVCASETGSGKTFTYLLPLLSFLVRLEKDGFVRKVYRPRAIIVVPSRQLVVQLEDVMKKLKRYVKFRGVGMVRMVSKKELEWKFNRPVDILVGTPRVIGMLFEDGVLTPAHLRCVVLDEADSLLGDDEFCKDVEKMIMLGRKASDTQGRRLSTIVVSATLPKAVADTEERLFPNAIRCVTPLLHKTIPKLKQFFLDLKKYSGNRDAALLEVLSSSARDKVMVFCNGRKSCEIVYKMLKEKGVEVGILHGGGTDSMLEQASRATGLTKDDGADQDDKHLGESNAALPTQNDLPRVIVCTDYASRGLDTSAITHVVNYDFPTTIPDYLHRVGRTARAGNAGRATSLIGKKDRNLSERIWKSIRIGSILS